jgi:hypothetical protein
MLLGCLQPAVAQRSPSRKPDPQQQLLEYYRQYPDRYIRISKESWVFARQTREAFHSFTLTSLAGIGYSEIEIQIAYQNSEGKSLQTQKLKLAGFLAPFGTMQVKQLRVKKVPAACDKVVLTVTEAVMYR